MHYFLTLLRVSVVGRIKHPTLSDGEAADRRRGVLLRRTLVLGGGWVPG